MSDYFRDNIAAMDGYTPGEQPRTRRLIKLNTNENPYPPSPGALSALKNGFERLRLYPDPTGDDLRDAIAGLHGLDRGNVILGNGSDDILTIATRSFVDQGGRLACLHPSYSLYPVLAEIQGAECAEVELDDDFSLPEDILERAGGAGLFFIPRPNAPTGTVFDSEKMESLCRGFGGIVFIDEAYADFADSDCVDFVGRFPNVVVGRTLSKSYSLAGLRLGYALASKEIIAGMMKVKDSYNVGSVTQSVALAALRDRDYLDGTLAKIRGSRARLADALAHRGFKVEPSGANFLFVSPPCGDGGALFEFLRGSGIVTRYFPGARTGDYIRITIGTDRELDELIVAVDEYLTPSAE